MKFDPQCALEILERTPSTLRTMLSGISEPWYSNNEGGETWSPYDVIGHLVHGERTDWMTRMEICLSDGPDKQFAPFDRFAQFHESKGKSLEQLLTEFETARKGNLDLWKAKNLSPEDYHKTGVHPAFGEVTLAQLVSTWAVHDLNHIAQVSRVMAHQYKSEVGPWVEYLRILN